MSHGGRSMWVGRDMGLPSPWVVYWLGTGARRGGGRHPCPTVACPWGWQGHGLSNALGGFPAGQGAAAVLVLAGRPVY